MNPVRSITFSITLATLSAAAVFACGGTVEQPQTTASALTKAPLATSTHGIVKAVGDALGEVALRPDQRAEIEKLLQDAEARHVPTADGRKALMLAFADQVENGKVDKAALQPLIDKVAADVENVRGEDRAALARLHALLDPEQRDAFVDALEAQRKARHGEPTDPLRGIMKIKQLAGELKLTEEQRSQIHGLVFDGFKDAMKKHFDGSAREGETTARHGRPHMGRSGAKHALAAFREDTLDLDKVVPPHDVKKMASFGADRASAVAEKILPLLTPEQRKIAADKLRAVAENGEGALLGP